MKIALVSDWYYPKIGGVASHMHNLALKLKERGHEVAIVTNNWETGKESELAEKGIDLIKIPGVVSPVLDINLSYGLKSSEELNEFLHDFDVIHSHHAFTPLALKAAKAGRIMNKATLLTTHSISFAHDSRLWEALGLTIPVFTSYLKYPHRIIAVSKAARAFVEHFTDSPISIIPNGVDDKRFTPLRNKEELKSRLGIEGKVVLYVSRMAYRKGPHVLLNAFSKIEDATLVMVGNGEMLPFLKLQAKFLGIDEKVVFMGYVEDNKLPELFGIADVFVLPSVTAEAFGIVVLEAMAAGVPVVATSVGGIPEIVKENEAGILVPPGNELALRNAIQRILTDQKLREWYGSNGRRAVEEKYSWDKVVLKIEKAYEEVLLSK
ncbi:MULTISPECIES: glycosyltransferase family 4 protein [Thermococcus]|uniref:Glycosyl transferase n=2 Tax=Thermococcus sibiricus TaxID=172049 RepID=C6A2S1_THESM|nr:MULTISPECIES: glycosyltransferase family 4 protein [Thermococcus]KUK28650.1 MAG: Glycosyl transferase [Thermococcus sp. 40_45]HII67754.1 glycosyltransferase family 4 protein [Thermococcaceae archaeon]ACS89916.1 Glycosyl transferase [Thermococcus sibiricus MM 739]KUK17072.1 MAG: Glycosyl transferase [Thermococcus sibiricus]MBC7095127.1 glycosyltransferase family 4 protein [Thermococcus sp.]